MNPSAELSSPASRALVIEHERIVAEQADRHAVTLESVLAILRSTRLDDRAARALAVETAAAALVVLRTSTDQQRSALLEPVTGAFARLRTDLRPLVRHGDLDVQFVEPPATGRALPAKSPTRRGRSSAAPSSPCSIGALRTACASNGIATGSTC